MSPTVSSQGCTFITDFFFKQQFHDGLGICGKKEKENWINDEKMSAKKCGDSLPIF